MRSPLLFAALSASKIANDKWVRNMQLWEARRQRRHSEGMGNHDIRAHELAAAEAERQREISGMHDADMYSRRVRGKERDANRLWHKEQRAAKQAKKQLAAVAATKALADQEIADYQKWRKDMVKKSEPWTGPYSDFRFDMDEYRKFAKRRAKEEERTMARWLQQRNEQAERQSMDKEDKGSWCVEKTASMKRKADDNTAALKLAKDARRQHKDDKHHFQIAT